MKINRADAAIFAITLAFLCFTGGFFAGRSRPAKVVTVSELPQAETVSQGEEPEDGALPLRAFTVTDTESGVQKQFPEPEQQNDETAGLIDLNTAGKSELMELPGIGEKLSERIIAYREERGPFSDASEVMNVSGIGEAKYAAIKDLIYVKKQS